MNEGLLPGSLVWRKDVHAALVDHYGVVLALDPIRIAHIDKGAEGRLRVKRQDSFEEFAAGHRVSYGPRTTPILREAMERRITEIENSLPPFGLLAIGSHWNCESFAKYVSQGAPDSTQATAAKGILAVIATVGFALLNENGTSVDGNGYRRAKNGQFAKRRWL
jgi:hypothetical protein